MQRSDLLGCQQKKCFMKFLLSFMFLLTLMAAEAQLGTRTINNIIGDDSFIKTFGYAPDETTDEKTRIQTHLVYVEKLLRSCEPENLTAPQKRNRAMVLDLLNQYSSAGNFPSNLDYPDERRPCFIDHDGNICAVGYLVAETAGIEVAEEINSKHQYDFLLDMKEEALSDWAAENGLTLEECAMIQPTYGPPVGPDYAAGGITPGYAVGSAIVGGSNVVFSVLTLTGNKSKAVGYVGLATGTLGIIMGAVSIRPDEQIEYINGYPETISYKQQRNLSYLNIAMGTTCLVSSAINLLMIKKERKNTISLYSYPGINNKLNVGFSLTRKI